MAFKTSVPGALPLPFAIILSLATLYVVWKDKKSTQAAFGALLPLVSLGFYRVFLHPLSKYPGPVANKLTTFPILRKAFKGIKHRYVRELHDKYGPVVRLGPNELSFCTPSALQRIYSATEGFGKSDPYELHPMAHKADGLFFILDKAKHRQRRKIWNRSFTTPALTAHRGTFVTTVERFITHILKDMDAKGFVDVERRCGQWAWDTTDSVWFAGKAFKKSFLETDDMEIPEKGASSLILFDIMAFVPVVFYILKSLPLGGKYRELEDVSNETSKRIFTENIGAHEGISYMLNGKESDEPLDPRDLPFEVESILMGGSDTSHATSTFLMYNIAKQADWTKRVREELDQALNGSDLAENIGILDTLPIFNAFLQESLRFGQLFSGLPRLSPPGGAVVDDRFVPGGTTVSVPIYGYHMDYDAFGRDARAFNPDRWLDQASPANKNPFYVFGAGAGKCVGMKMAYLELRIFLALVVSKLDVKMEEGFDDDLWWEGTMNWRSHKFGHRLNVKVYPRNN